MPNEKFSIYALNIAIVEEAVLITNELEMHDLIIVATANFLNIPIISKDHEITKAYKKTIW